VELVLTVLAAVVPSALLVRTFYTADVHPEPRHVVLITFLLGIAIVIPVVAVAGPLLAFLPESLSPPLAGLYMAFLCAAIPEEVFKFFVVNGYSARHPAFDEPMDGVVYGAVASLGFATLENVLYVLGSGWGTALVRALTAVPMHAFLGAILGYYVGRARLGRGGSALTGLGAAVLLHGLYDWPLMVGYQSAERGQLTLDDDRQVWAVLLLALLTLAVLAWAGVWTWRIVRRLRREQQEGRKKWWRHRKEAPAASGE
jgi:RsiW-degrading membrane proteinase PrsW (M82 family)